MESDQSYSDDSSNSSESSSGSSDGDEEVMEPVRILGHTLQLPQELCEDYSVFKEFFSMKTWDDLSDEHKEYLKKFLPKFRKNDAEEKEKTIEMLFNHEPFHFTSPLGDFYNNLRQGNYRPDIAKMRKFLQKARAKQQKHKIKSYYAKLFPEVLISRERLLAAAKSAPPGLIPRIPPVPPKPSSKFNYKPVYLRVRQRYFEELTAIRSEVGGEESEDENYPEGPPEQPAKKKKLVAPTQNLDGSVLGTLAGPDSTEPNSLQCLKNILAAHRARRQYRENHPELSTTGITLDDIKQRVALVNGAKKMFGGQKSDAPAQKLKRGPKKESVQKQMKPPDGKGVKRKEDQLATVENKPLLPNIKIKCEQEESDSESSSFVDPVASPQHIKKYENFEIKQEEDVCPSKSNINYNDSKLETMIKQEPQDPTSQASSRIIHQPVPIKLEDLDGIDMMALPVEIADDSGDVLQVDQANESNTASESIAESSLTQTTYASFLSLVRALFPASAAHRATRKHLHASCAAVINSPIAPLNTWYNLCEDWCAQLDSALEFLAGERGPHPDDFVPYLQFKPETQMYQWIGAGRDGDATLGRLCARWLRGGGWSRRSPPAPPPPPALPHQPDADDTPPPRYPTTWMVRPATTSETEDFQAQERKRFAAPAKPFTYVQHGYRSVVGPCGRVGAGSCALLSPSRPRPASLPALVRDALARLPNGQGTASHVLTMLKMSQWVVSTNDQVLLAAVSSTLERFLTAKRDPLVKFDHATATWTYLHRHRSEEDWCKTPSRKSGSGKARATPIDPPPTPPPALETSIASTPSLGPVEEILEEGSDTDVDVEDRGSPLEGARLSSAQLLMRAAQHNAQHTPPSSHKLVPVSPHKAKAVLAKQVPHKINVALQGKRAIATPKQSDTASSVKTPTATKANPTATKANPTATKATPSAPTKPPPTPPQARPTPLPTKQSPPQPTKPTTTPTSTQQPKATIPKSTVTQSARQSPQSQPKPLPALMLQSAKQASLIAQLTKPPVVKQTSLIQKQATVNVPSSESLSPSSTVKQTTNQPIKQVPVVKPVQSPKQEVQKIVPVSKPATTVAAQPLKSPLIKQRPLQQKQVESSQAQPVTTSVPPAPSVVYTQTTTVIQPPTASPTQAQVQVQIQNKPMPQGTRSLLIRPTAVQKTVTVTTSTTPTQISASQRRGIVRVLSPAAATGKSLISPRALMQQGIPAAKKRPPQESTVTTVTQNTGIATSAGVSGGARAVQVGGSRVAVGGLVPVRLPSGHTVHLAPPHPLRHAPRALPAPKTHNLHIPLSTVQLAGQTVQIAGQTVQIAGQSVQLTGHTVKLPSGQSVQVAGQSVQMTGQSLQMAGQSVQVAGQSVQVAGQSVQVGGQSVQVAAQSVQVPNQTVQLPGGQTVQLAGGNVQLSGQSVQLAGQTVQLGGQTVQLAGQTVQLPGGQTVQLSGGQTLQLASGQTVQLGQKAAQMRTQVNTEKPTQPIIAKLLTNAQGHVVSVGGPVCGSGGSVQVCGVRVLPSPPRAPRPFLLTGKPLHSCILQQSDGSAIRVTSSGQVATSQIVLSSIGAQSLTTSTATTPVLKLQQGMSNTVPSSGIRSVLMDGQQLKLVGGRHVLARILRPAQPPQPPPQ